MQNRIIPGCEPRFWEGNKIGCLLLHGFSSSPFEMRLLGEHLHSHGFTVNIPLLPGHGTSPAELRGCLWYDWFQAAKEELFKLRQKCDKIIVVGLSTGGSLALHLAAHYEVDGVAALAPGLYLKNKFARLSHILHRILHNYSKRSGRPDVRADVQTISYNKIPLRSVSELLKLFSHLKRDLPDIYTPLLLIYSTSDHVVDSKSALTIYEEVSSTDKRILQLKESYHILTLDLEKEKVFSEVLKFISHLI